MCSAAEGWVATGEDRKDHARRRFAAQRGLQHVIHALKQMTRSGDSLLHGRFTKHVCMDVLLPIHASLRAACTCKQLICQTAPATQSAACSCPG